MNDIVSEYLHIEGFKEIKITVGKLARQTDASVEIRSGKTVMLFTVVCGKNDRKECDFLPLHVDYQEKFYAVGKIPIGGKRENKLNDHEILISRLVDRCVRPAFEKSYNVDTQVNITLLSVDCDTIVEDLACFGSSLALLLSKAAFLNPVSEISVYLVDNKWIVNPSLSDRKKSIAKIIVGGNKDSVVMIEGSCQEIDESKLVEGIVIAQDFIKKECLAQENFVKKITNIEKFKIEDVETYGCTDDIYEKLKDDIFLIYNNSIEERKLRNNLLENLFCKFKENNEGVSNYDKLFKKAKKEALTKLLRDENKRIDGRIFDGIRNISCEVDYLPSAHGSALFTRGETQALATVTLGDKKDEAFKEGVLENGVNKLFLHYNFPSYSVGEIGGIKATSRREVGHGNLALNGLLPVIPTEGNDSMYTIRIVSDILSSNGSSSMATVCSGSLALMDAGIHTKSHVAGIAMGLLLDEINKVYIILSDINADEDELGDMDFKVVRTEKGITAIQLDVKKICLQIDVLSKALNQAKCGIDHILNKMNETISSPREQVKDFAPCFDVFKIPKQAIGQIIGVGGSNIQNIIKETNSYVYIEEKNNVGTVKIYSKNRESLEACKDKISKFTVVPTVGEIYKGTVKMLTDSVAYIEFLPKKIGLLDKDELDLKPVDNLQTHLKIGDVIDVKIIQKEKRGGFKLSCKAIIDNPNNIIQKEIDRVPENI